MAGSPPAMRYQREHQWLAAPILPEAHRSVRLLPGRTGRRRLATQYPATQVPQPALPRRGVHAGIFRLQETLSSTRCTSDLKPPTTIARFASPHVDHESFAAIDPLALLGSAFYSLLVHRLADYAPRLLPTLGHHHAVALRSVRCDQLTTGLPPARLRPCWAHTKKSPGRNPGFLLERRCVLSDRRRRRRRDRFPSAASAPGTGRAPSWPVPNCPGWTPARS